MEGEIEWKGRKGLKRSKRERERGCGGGNRVGREEKTEKKPA